MSQDPPTLPTSNLYDDIIGSTPAPTPKDPNQGIKSSNRFGAQRPGHIHSGTDFGGAIDSDVGAADDGDVIFAGPDGPKMGNAVKIRHADGTVSVYGHLNQVGTSIGAKVSRGDSIGLLGQTGNAKGPHVHFEVRPGGLSAVDPMSTSYRPLIGAMASKARQERQANAYDDIIGGSSVVPDTAYSDVIGDSKPLVQTTTQSLTPRQQAQQNLAKTYPPPAPTPVGPAGVEPPTTVSPVLERPRTTGVTTPADNGDRMIYNKMTGGFDQYTIDPGQIRPGERPTDAIRRLQMQDMVVDPQGAAERQAVAGQTFDGAAMFAPPGNSRNVLDKGYELPDQYTTRLSPEDEVKFHQWKQQYAPNDSGADYDLRGAFKAGLQPDPKTGHWPDTFKKPNHPTFSNQSQYAVGADAAKAGTWSGDTFVPPSAQPEGTDFFQAFNTANAHLAAVAEEKNNRAVVDSVLGPGMYDQSAALHPEDRAKLIENAKYEAQIKNTGQIVNTLNTRQDQINRQAQFRRQQARIAMAKAQRVKTIPQPSDGPWGGVYDRLRDTSSVGFGGVRRAEGRDAKAQAVVDRELARQGPGLDPLADRIHASLQSEGLVGSRPQPLPRHLSEQQIAALDKIVPLTNADKQSLRDGTPLPPSSVAYSLAPAPATIGPLSFGERVKNSIYNAIQDYAPGLASLNTEEGIKLNPISGAVRGASLGLIKIPEYRASSIPTNVGDPTKQISQYDADLADKTGEVLGALAPYVGVNKLLTMASEAPKVATFLNAVRETGMVGRAGVRAAQTATTFGTVSALRETVKAIQGQGGSASDVAKTIGQDAVLGGSIGVLAGDNPNLIRHIYSFVVPAVTMAAVTGKSSSPVSITGDPVTDSGIFNALMAVATHQGAVIEPITEAAKGVGREVAAPISRAPITPEWLRSRVAEPGGLQHIVLRETAPPEGSGEALARYGDQTPTGRALSVYRDPTDPTNHKIGGTEIDGSKTPDYEQRGVKIVDVTPAQYEQALKSVNSINPTEPSQLSAPLPATPQIADVASPSSTGSPIARSMEEMTAPESAQASRAAAEQTKAPLAPGTEPVSAPGEAAAPVLRALQRAHQAGDQPSIDALTKLASERGASQADIDSTKPAVTPPTVETPRVPERPETVQSQLEALTEGRGSRSAVIIPEGHDLPAVPAGLEAHVADNGDTFIYDPKKTSPEAIDKTVEAGTTNKLIGAVEPEGPKTDQVVVARKFDGTEAQAVYTSPENVSAQVAEFQAQHPDSTIEVGTKATEQKVLDERRAQVEQLSQPYSDARIEPDGLLGNKFKVVTPYNDAPGASERGGFKTREAAQRHLDELRAQSPVQPEPTNEPTPIERALQPSILAWHGSPVADLNSFDVSKVANRTDVRLNPAGEAGYGLYFSTDKVEADTHAPDGGKTYQVQINASRDRFLDFESALKDQSPFVQSALQKLGIDKLGRLGRIQREGGAINDALGATVYDALVEHFGNGDWTFDAQRKASEALASVGIKGNKYLGNAKGDNYVVFNGDDVGIANQPAAQPATSVSPEEGGKAPPVASPLVSEGAKSKAQGIWYRGEREGHSGQYSINKPGSYPNVDAIYFSNSPEEANTYARTLKDKETAPAVMRAQLDVRNPWILEGQSSAVEVNRLADAITNAKGLNDPNYQTAAAQELTDLAARMQQTGETVPNSNLWKYISFSEKQGSTKARAILEAAGYDAYQMRDEIGVFRPEQILDPYGKPSPLSPTQGEAKVEPATSPATAKEVIKGAGYQYVGEQQRPKGKSAYQLFNDETGSTLTLRGDNVTPESIRAKVEASRKQRGLDPLPAKTRLKGETSDASDQVKPASTGIPSSKAEVEVSTSKPSKPISAGAGKPASPPTLWESAKIGDTVEHEGKPVELAGRDLREVKAKQIAEKSGGQVIPDPQNAKRFAVVKLSQKSDQNITETITNPKSLIDEVSTLVDDKGKLTRGGDVVTSLMKDRSDAEVQALKDWADKHKSPAIQRFVGGGAAAELRSREKEEPAHEFNSTQVNLPPDIAKLVKAASMKIADEDLAEDGRDEHPHITLAFGINDDESDNVEQVLKGEEPITAKIGKVSMFPASESGKADVLKIDVTSRTLHRLHKKIGKEVDVTDTHPSYKPHITLAYVKPGRGSKYVGMETGLEGREVMFDEVAFSDKDREQTAIPLGGDEDAVNQQQQQKGGKRKYQGTPPRPAVREDSSEVREGQSKQASSSDRAEPGQVKASLESAPAGEEGEVSRVHSKRPVGVSEGSAEDQTEAEVTTKEKEADQKAQMGKVPGQPSTVPGVGGRDLADESHKGKNAMGQGQANPTQTGQAMIDIQTNLPNARVLYSSATGATEVRNMAYMTRLGLWGKGTAFPGGFIEFMGEIDRGGVGSMEMVSRDMKALGMYVSRSLSFRGVDYQETIHELTPEQRVMYNHAAAAMQMVLKDIYAALDVTDASPRAKMAAMQRFWGDHQRIFRQLISAFKVPTVIKQTEQALKDGKSVVIGLIGTGESRTKEQITKALAAGGDLEDLDFSPREAIANMVDKAFPVNVYQEVEDPATGKVTKQLVRDKDSNPVVSQEALRLKNELLDKLSDVQLPENPLDQIVNHFGEKRVAELTGRKRRLIRSPDGKVGYKKRAPDGVAMKRVNLYEMERFQSGAKRIAIISDAASTGISLHASNREKNKQRRVHITLELGWSADKQMQTFGRTHRSDQASPPEYDLVSTDVGGEKRFSSTIARRLASLGALTKGQRDATGGGDLAKYNFETEEGKAALAAVYSNIMRDKSVEGLENPKQALRDMGVLKETEGGESIKDEDMVDVPRFLNRILALDLDRQNPMFDYFAHTFDQVIDYSKQNGTFDEGVADVKGESIRLKGEPQVVHKDVTTGAETAHYALDVDTKTTPVSFERAQAIATRKNAGFYKQKRSGNIIVARQSATHTDPATGSLQTTFTVTTPLWEHDHTIRDEELETKYEPIKAKEAQNWWEQKFESVPKIRTAEMHVIGGAILPLWQKLKTEEGARLKVVRVMTDNGQRVVGIQIPNSQVASVLRSIGIGRELKAPKEIFEAVLDQGDKITLADGLSLVRSKFHGDEAIEVKGANYHKHDQLREMGLLNERIDWTQKFFVPTDEATGVPILTKLLESYPALEESKAPISDEEMYARELPDYSDQPRTRTLLQSLAEGNQGVPWDRFLEMAEMSEREGGSLVKSLLSEDLVAYMPANRKYETAAYVYPTRKLKDGLAAFYGTEAPEEPAAKTIGEVRELARQYNLRKQGIHEPEIDDRTAGLMFARDLEDPDFEEIRKGGEELGRQIEGDFPVGIKNADTEKDRANLGLDPIIIEARKVMPTIDQALRDFNPERAYELVKAIGEHSRNLSGEETAQMTIYKVHLKHEYRSALNALRQAQDDADGSEQVARIRLAILDQQLQDYHEMGRRTAYEWHFTGLMRQQMMKADYSIEEVKMGARALYGDVLPEDLQQQLEDLVKERDNAIEALRVYDEQKSLEAAEQRLKDLQEQERREERNRKARQSQKWRENQEKEKVRVKVVTKIVSREALDDEFDQMSRDLDAMLTSDMGLNPFLEPRLLSQLKKMATNRVKAGADTVEDWILPVWERIKGKRLVLDAGATERDLRDALSGYGKTIQMSKEEIDIKLRELRALARDVSALEDIQGGQRPARSGLQRDKQTQRQRESKKRINAALREYNIQVETSERSPEDLQQSALDSMKTRLRNRIEDLKTYIEGGERALKRPGVQPDPEAKILIAERDRLQKVLDDIEGPSKKTDDEKIALATAAVERSIADYEKRIPEGDVLVHRKASEPWSRELGRLKKRQTELKAQVAEDRKNHLTTKAEAAERILRGLKSSIDRIERRAAAGDLSVTPKAPPSVSTPEIEAAKAQRKALRSILAKMRRDAKPEKTDAEKYASRLVALHKKLDKREAELNEMLRTGMFTKRARPMPIRDPGIDAKRAAVKRAEDQIEMKLKEIDRENRGNWQKFVGHVAGVRRAVVLSSTFVIGKLTNAAMARIILSIGEEVAGAPLPYLPIIGVVARQAPSEGRLNLKAEYKHITKAFSREMIQQAAKVLKTGKMDIDILHGKKKEGGHPDSWYEFIGHVHGMLKTPAKIAAFERYMEKNLAWLHLHGYDVTSEPIKAIAAARAVIDANRAILQQDNVVSELFKKIMSVLEAKKYPTSEDPKKRQMQKFPTAAAFLRFMLPVTRVPPNFLFESINYTPIGFAIAAARLGKAIYTHGLDEASYAPGGGGGDGEPPRNPPPSGNPFDRGIPPDDADAIIRGIKKATLGSPFMVLALLSALGLINFVQFGGYYRRGKKKKPEDVPFGGVRILGFNLPSWAGHIPLFEAMQMITTAVQVFQDYRDKDKEVQESATHAALDTARGMASEIPFYEEPSRALTAMEQPEGAAQYAGDIVRGFVMPPDLQRAARVWDPGEPTTAWQKTGEMTGFRRSQAVKRKPEGSFIHRVGQEIELGVPGLRKNVPANTEVNRTDIKEGFTNQVRQLKVMVGETRYQKLTLGAPGVDDPDERERQRIQTWNNLSDTQRNAWTKTMMQIEAAKDRGQLKPDDPGDIAKDAQETPLQQQFSGKDIKEALIAYSHMSPEKRAEVKDLLIEKGPSIEKAYVTDQPELRRRFKELIGEDPGIKKRNQPGPTSKQWLNILKDPGQPSSSPPQ